MKTSLQRMLPALFVLAAIGLASLLAADAAPQITAEQRAKFWKAQAEYISISARAQKAEETLKAIQADLAKVCGATHQLALDQEGEPSCVAKPEPKKEAAK